ncbi:hypothetical protein E3N88_45561 [Mikania micrantha]|uniref:SBP-type domain-containing protein n=1 Tax=Mikania micrantha TaxID=192012 RepID=A0A5N6L8T1_9ASTR|nr:hypothetical protein E3N88_45561 [Mikania micrantha]
MDMGGSSSSSDSQLLQIGLKFGKKIYFEDVGVGDDLKSEGGLSPVSGGGGPQKKGRNGGGVAQVGLGQLHGPQPPRCQVEGCNLDLSDAKTYYSRHKVCGAHSKTAKVVVNGLEQRFCQQCSRFHQLPEFDQGKRSCRRRLAGHNERRRKPTSGTLLSARYGSLPSSIFGGCFNGVQESNCALSLLSNHSSVSRNHTLTHDYYVSPHVAAGAGTSAHMVQPQTGTMVQGQSHFSTDWGYDTDEAHLGLGQIAQSGGYSGDLGPGQQGGRRYDASVDHIDWSL